MQSLQRVLATVMVAAGLALAILAAPARAQTPEQILDYTVDLQIEADGTLLVTEGIAYDFGSEERHGIRQPGEGPAQRVDTAADAWQQHPASPTNQPRPTLGLGAADQPGRGSVAGVEPDRRVQQQTARLIQRDRRAGSP
jgi:hypothetical protein